MGKSVTQQKPTAKQPEPAKQQPAQPEPAQMKLKKAEPKQKPLELEKTPSKTSLKPTPKQGQRTESPKPESVQLKGVKKEDGDQQAKQQEKPRIPRKAPGPMPDEVL